MRLVVPDGLKFHDPRLNRSRNIRLKGVVTGIFDSFFRDNFRPEVASDVKSGVVVDRRPVWVLAWNLIILGQTVLELFEPLTE